MRIAPPTAENIAYAARLLREGVLVGMPTETVYGIAALATDADAVERVYAVKRRPRDNPLIVHIASQDQLALVAREVTETARRLTERFWPGPLTVVLPKAECIPDIVTSGKNTVAVRIPAHPVALDLIRAAGPISAPSANLFMSLSPTLARDIEPQLAEMLGIILDGGPSKVGVESTVVDCTGPTPRLLRPGVVDRAQIEAAIGTRLVAPPAGPRRAPGMYRRHYAPNTPLRIVERLEPNQAGITFETPANPSQIRLQRDARLYAAALYAVLHRLDEAGHEILFVEAPPQSADWEAVWDRLTKATGTEP
jgi:L-threonylcarbamoyladenylate synthase